MAYDFEYNRDAYFDCMRRIMVSYMIGTEREVKQSMEAIESIAAFVTGISQNIDHEVENVSAIILQERFLNLNYFAFMDYFVRNIEGYGPEEDLSCSLYHTAKQRCEHLLEVDDTWSIRQVICTAYDLIQEGKAEDDKEKVADGCRVIYDVMLDPIFAIWGK